LNLKEKVIDKAMYWSFFAKDISSQANDRSQSANTIEKLACCSASLNQGKVT
jgi:hypothetical protein